ANFPCARARPGRARKAASAIARTLFMVLLRLLDLHQVRLDAVLRQRLADAVDLVELLVRPHAYAIPGALVRQVGGLDARLEAEDREARLLVVGVGRVLERPGLYEINVLRHFLLTGGARGAQPLAQLALANRLFRAGQNLVEVELWFLRRRRGRGGALRQAGDGRRLAGVLLRGLGFGGDERHRRAIEVESDPQRNREADHHAGEEAEQKAACRALARGRCGSRWRHLHLLRSADA